MCKAGSGRDLPLKAFWTGQSIEEIADQEHDDEGAENVIEPHPSQTFADGDIEKKQCKHAESGSYDNHIQHPLLR